MTRGLEALASLCDELPDRIDAAVNQIKIDVCIRMATDLIEHTPVDVTTAASNWQASINAPALFDLPAIYPGRHGSTAAESRREAIAHVTRVAEDVDPGVPLYLSNLTDYIVDLNNGSSRQEPPGFFQRGILVGERYAQHVTLRY